MKQIGTVDLSGKRQGTVYYEWRPEADRASHTLTIDVVHDTPDPISPQDQMKILELVEKALRNRQ